MNYDSLKLVLTNEYDPTVDFLQVAMPDLAVNTRGVEYGIPVIKGTLRNLKVRINRSKITIEGSIHVFWKGNNLEAMTFHEFIEAIDLLQAMLNLPIDDARVSRLDFSGNIIVKHPVDAYFTYFGQKSRFRKQVMESGVMYCSEELVHVFYDKIKSQRRKREEVPEYFQKKNVLRFEMRFIRKLGKSFNLPEVTLKTLKDPAFFNNLCHRWRHEFKSVTKEMTSPTQLIPTGSKSNLTHQLAILQLLQIGTDNVLNQIAAWQSIGSITKKEAYECRKFINEKTSEKYPLAENPLITELNQKIKVAARFEV